LIARVLLCAAAGLALSGAASALAAPAGRSAEPTSIFHRSSSDTCSKASARYVAAKKSLRELKAGGASGTALRHAKRRVLSAYRAILKACGALFDVTGVSGSFDATLNAQDHGDSCTWTKDAHWTASLGPGAEPASLEVFTVDRHGRPSYAFGADIPILERGTGEAKVTCNEPSPGENGTTTCTFNQAPAGEISIQTDTGGRLDPQTLMWVFGYNSFSYNRPTNGGACSYGGARPPYVDPSTDSASLFVHPLNDGSNALEPPGITTVPAADFAHSLTLPFSGSKTISLDSTLESTTLNANWQMNISLHRR
jgi:hypothetical protein